VRKIFIILICLLIASPAFAGKKPKKLGKNVEHHIVTGEHSVKSTLLKNEGFEILKKALK